jgi:hypothetical protein
LQKGWGRSQGHPRWRRKFGEREKRRMKEKERELIAWFWRIQEARRREKGG